MEKLFFEININAPREKVWHILWNDTIYPMWTAVFSEGSRAVTTWKKGSQALFLNAENDGMISEIAENIPYEYMSLLHKGMVNKGVEDTESPQIKEWYGAMENYTLKSVDGKTLLSVDLDVTDEYKDYFKNTWPLALEKVKLLAEEKN